MEKVVPAPDSKISKDSPAETSLIDNDDSMPVPVLDFIVVEDDREPVQKKRNDRLSLKLKKRYWVKDLSLPWTEKNGIVYDRTLTCDSMHAAQKVMRNQFPFIGGLQDSGHVPIFNDAKNKWHYEFPMLPIATDVVAQIHHTGTFHWVMSAKFNNKVYVFDSLMHTNSHLSPSLQIQLCAIYANNSHSLEVLLSTNNQQSNGVDCGVFAIANLTNFAYSMKYENESMFTNEFDVEKIRPHLITSFEAQKFREFPITKVKPAHKFHKVTIPMDCINCDQPNVFEDMLQCDRCCKWMHYSCNIIEVPKPTPEKWWCSNCKK